MGFVQFGFLAALAGIAVPIVIHLVFGQRARRVDLGTLRFLRIALSQNARRKRLKRWLLLALRVGAVALLAVLFARPFLLALQRRGFDRLVVILIDRSGSMGLETTRGRLYDQALSEAQRILRSYGSGTQIERAFFDHTVHPVSTDFTAGASPPVPDGRASGRTPNAEHGAPPNSTTDYGAALAWARDICLQSTRARKEIYLLTDLQGSGLGRTPAEPLPQGVRVHVIDLGQPFPRNAAVTRVAPSRTIARPGEGVTVSATIFNASQFPLRQLPVVLHLQQGQRQRNWRSQVSLEPGASEIVEFAAPELNEGVWQGYVMVEADDELRFDNRCHTAMLIAPPIEVLMVDGDPSDSPVTSETYFLESALQLAPSGKSFSGSRYSARVVACSEGIQVGRSLRDGQRVSERLAHVGSPLPEFGRAAVIVLANVAGLSESDAGRLARFAEAGGGLLIFAGDRAGPDMLARLSSAGIPLGQTTGPRPAPGLPWRLDRWEREHPVFQPFSDPQYGDLHRLAFRCFTAIEPGEGTSVLARFQDGSPALVERALGRGKILWFASSCDRQWSDWPRSRLFVPVVHQLIGYLAGLIEGGPIRSRRTDQFESSGPVPEPGVYDRGGFVEVVNVDPRESETDRCRVADLASQFRFVPADPKAEPGAEFATAGVVGREIRQDEIWHWVLLALLALLLAEGFLANRTTT
jgi:hypothetical protein